MIDIGGIARRTLSQDPFPWAFIGDLFSKGDAEELAASFPRDHFKTVAGYDGEKGYEYEARSLIGMGKRAPSHAGSLSPAWRALAEDLLSPDYRSAIARLTGRDELARVPIEVNVFHYGPAAWLGPHVDLKDKLATHILYFNRVWDRNDGGCLTILRSSDPADVAAEIEPRVGGSSVVVRSERSWHAVSRVASGCAESRRSMTITFYRPGSVSTLWPPGDRTRLHDYPEGDRGGTPEGSRRAWAGIRKFLRLGD